MNLRLSCPSDMVLDIIKEREFVYNEHPEGDKVSPRCRVHVRKGERLLQKAELENVSRCSGLRCLSFRIPAITINHTMDQLSHLR